MVGIEAALSRLRVAGVSLSDHRIIWGLEVWSAFTIHPGEQGSEAHTGGELAYASLSIRALLLHVVSHDEITLDGHFLCNIS